MFLILSIIIVVVLLVVATTRFKVHPFIVLLLAALTIGFAGGLKPADIISAVTGGFGGTLQAIGIVIAAGTIIGTFLEKSGGARVMAMTVLKWVGRSNTPLAMSLTGYIVSIPVFCDSGFVILSALNRALSKTSQVPLAVLAIALGTGLYTTHVFVPPTPGPLAAAATIGADIGYVLLLGLLISVPVALAGLLWAILYCKKFRITVNEISDSDENTKSEPAPALSFSPIVVPILLIALKSVADYPSRPLGEGLLLNVLSFIGHPVVALLIGVFLSFMLYSGRNGNVRLDWVERGIRNAGAIILITGAGGAFGAVLRAVGIGEIMEDVLVGWQVGIFLPFIIAAALKTAQGSSTVAIVTTAAIVAPLLEPMGLSSPFARALTVLAIGAGSMTVSHVNDSYFWVVAKFSSMDMATALRAHTVATLIQGITGITVIALVAWLFL
jgi:gluconate:H+ symporter, GntP family